MVDENLDRLFEYDCIVFDFDGVLVDSNLIKRDMFFKIWGDYACGREQYISAVLQQPGDRYTYISNIYQYLNKHGSLPAEKERYIDQYTERVEASILEKGVQEKIPGLLHSLRDRILLINSATPEKALKRIVSNLGLDRYIREARGRPAEKGDIFSCFSRTYRIDCSNMVFVGDSLSDLKAAEETGIDFIGVRSPGGDLFG